MTVSVLLPSRGRPDGLRRMVTTARETAEAPIDVVVYADDDDPATAEAAEALDVQVIVGPRIVLSEAWNRCYDRARYPIVMHAGDDLVFQSPGWDTAVASTFDRYPDRVVLVHGDDGHWGAGFGTHSFLHDTWVQAVGVFVPPYFSCDYNDTWLNEVANAIGRRVYLPEVVTTHLHPNWGTAPLDQTHQERLARGEQDNVADLYARLADERQAWAAKLRTVMA